MGYYLLDHPNPNYKQYRETRRNGATVSGGIILHDAEGGTDLDGADMGAENVARYISVRTTPGSYHVLVDRDSTIPMVPLDYETWHDTTSNNYTVGISVAWNKADLARMTPAQREAYYHPFAAAVRDAVAWFARRGITVPTGRFLSRDEIVARRPGISTHSRMDPSRRSDPFGTGSPYESEFLAVLNGATSTPTPQEDEMNDLDRFMLTQLWQERGGMQETLAGVRALLKSVGAIPEQIAAVATPDVDEQAIAGAVLAALTPEAIAAAIPGDIATQVADELAKRLAA